MTFARHEKQLHILAIEDDPRMLDLLRKSFWEHGHTVMTAADGVAGLSLACSHEFDVVVLDIGLPGMDGYQIALRLRAEQRSAAILMLTARDREDDVIRGLDLGADDYIRKPFSFPELLARIDSVTRRAGDAAPRALQFEDLQLDLQRRELFRGAAHLWLSPNEFALMEKLMRHASAPVPRAALIASVWGSGAVVTSGALDTLVNTLRDKLDAHSPRTVIRTIRGFGYCLERCASLEEANRGGGG